jgi:acetyltransferase-like isoleucine patch superfamily enzyme
MERLTPTAGGQGAAVLPEGLRARRVQLSRRLDVVIARSRVRRFRRRVRVAASWQGSTVLVEIDRDALIARSVTVEVWPSTTSRIVVGAGSRIGDGVKLSLRGGLLEIGARTDLRRFGTYQVDGELRIGSGCVMSTGMQVHCAERVEIGDMTIIGEYTTIADSRHLRTADDDPVHDAITTAPVSIGRNIWMGAHAVIASGTTIGDGAFVAAGAVVTKDVKPGWLVAGVPAKPIRALTVESGP